MRMAADVKVGLFVLQNVFHLGHVMAWIAADVGHVDVDVFHMEKQILGILHPHDMVIDVAMHGAKRLEMSQGIGSLDVADVARMPQLVDVLEEVEELWDEGAMRVRKNTYFFHFKFTINPMASTSLNCTLEPSILTPASS